MGQELNVALLPDNDPLIFLREPCTDIEFYMADTKAASVARNRKSFTCRHCHFSGAVQPGLKKRLDQTFDWNGVTSHLFSK